MTDATAHDDHDRDDRADDELDATEDDQVDRDSVEGADPDLTVPGASDTAESGGRGADDRYVDGDLGGGAIGAEIDEDETEGDEA